MKVSKVLILILCVFSGMRSVHGQGSVNFNTQVLGPSAKALSLNLSSGFGDPLSGVGFAAQLYAAPGVQVPAEQLHAVGVPVPFRAGINAGYVAVSGTNKWGQAINPAVKIPGTIDEAGHRVATVQMRVWDAAFSTYELARGLGMIELSNIIQVNTGFPPNVPGNLVGLTFAVPEPSTLLLGFVGAAGWLTVRRRRSVNRL